MDTRSLGGLHNSNRQGNPAGLGAPHELLRFSKKSAGVSNFRIAILARPKARSKSELIIQEEFVGKG